MGLWNRLTHQADEPEPPPPAHISRDPDLDAVHSEQHDLIQQSGYAGERIRASWNKRRGEDGMAIQRERIFWERHGGEHQ